MPRLQNVGEVFVYEIDPGGAPGQPLRLTAREPEPRDLFGANLAISPDGHTIAVAARRAGGRPNLVEMFERAGDGAWRHSQTIESIEGYGKRGIFGLRINLGDTLMTVGASLYNTSGATRVYRRGGDGRWRFEEMFEAAVRSDVEHFGSWSAIDTATGDVLVASGLPGSLPSSQAGKITPFRRDAEGGWKRGREILAPTPSSVGFFAVEARVVGDHLYCGYSGDDTGGLAGFGSVVIYERDTGAPSGWRLADRILPPVEEPALIGFGARIDAAGGRVAAMSIPSNPEGDKYGMVHIAERRAAGGWRFVAEITGQREELVWLGRVVLGDGFFAIGSATTAGPGGETYAGAVYLFPDALLAGG